MNFPRTLCVAGFSARAEPQRSHSPEWRPRVVTLALGVSVPEVSENGDPHGARGVRGRCSERRAGEGLLGGGASGPILVPASLTRARDQLPGRLRAGVHPVQ